MPEDKDIGARLVDFAKKRFGAKRGWQTLFASALGMDPGSARKYLIGQIVPGSRVQAKLRGLGADVEYIMTGVSATEHADRRRRADADREAARVYFWAPDGVSDEVRKKYEKLAELIAKIPAHETEKIDAMVRAYLKSAMKGDKDDNKDRKAAP